MACNHRFSCACKGAYLICLLDDASNKSLHGGSRPVERLHAGREAKNVLHTGMWRCILVFCVTVEQVQVASWFE